MAKDTEDEQAQWRTLKLPAMRDRLAEVRDLLRQAAAVGLAQDVARLEALQDVHNGGGEHGKPQRRRYR